MCVNNNLVCVNNNNFLNLYSYELQISLIYTVTNRSLNFGREREREGRVGEVLVMTLTLIITY